MADLLPRQRVLVTGATGFLGRHLVPALAAAGREVVCPVRALAAVKASPSPSVRYFAGRLEDSASIRPLFVGIDVCVHLAAETASSSLHRHYISNVVTTRNVVDLCREAGVRKIVYTSSINTRLKQLGPYGKTKLEAEEIVRGSGLDYVVFVPGMIYGEGDAMVCATAALLRKLPLWPVVGSGNACRQPVHVDDVIAAIIRALEPDIRNRTYELGGPDRMSVNEYVDRVGECIGVRPRRLHLPAGPLTLAVRACALLTDRLPIGVEQCVSLVQDNAVDASDAVRDLGFRPRSFRDGLQSVLPQKPG